MTATGVAWLAALLFAGSVSAREAAVAATDDERQAPVTASFDTMSALPAESEQRIDHARQVVRDLQAQGGVYASPLSEALVELGRAYRDAGQHGPAARAFTEALQVARINHGLHNLRQVPYLSQVIAENVTLGRWDEVGGQYQYLYRIHKRNYGDTDPRLVPVIEEVVLAKLAIHNSASDIPVAFLQESLRLLDDVIEITELHYSDNIDRMAATLYLVARFNYAIAAQTGRPLDDEAYKRAGAGGRYGNYRTALVDDKTSQAVQLIARTERDGREALKRIEELYETHAPSSLFPRALAVVRQGDWRQLYRSGPAHKYYKRAYQLLEEMEGSEQQIARVFGKPRLLPARVPVQDAERAETAPDPLSPEGEILEFAFDVSAAGQPRNIRERQVPAHLTDEARQLRRHVEAWRFRPRMVDGTPVSTRMVQRFLRTDDGEFVVLATEPEQGRLAETEPLSP